ncbi:MAG TPA: LPS assembly protein LptD, partial [Stellaceae bacterium]|nr:LPS assembly protein LptD [Stellaceae bacterium]
LNLMNLYRESGSRVQRASLGTKLERPFTTSDGQLFNTFVSLRGDAYYSNVNHVSGVSVNSGGAGRLYPQAGIEWRYPFSRRFGHSTAIIEPKLAVYAAPNGGNPARIPDNDSQTFEFTDADLFTPDRLYGYDLVDGGQRADYAIHGSWYADNGYRADALFGQSYRFQKSSVFGPGTGLQDQASDYVGHVTFSPSDFLSFGYHFRLSQRSLQLEHQDVSTTVGPYWLKLNLGYVQLANDPRDQQSALKQITANVTWWIDNYWSINVGTVRNLGNSTSEVSTPANLNTTLFGETAGNSLNNSISVSYTDECITFRTSFIQSGIRDRDVKPGDAVVFQLVFKNLGEINLPTIKSGGG